MEGKCLLQSGEGRAGSRRAARTDRTLIGRGRDTELLGAAGTRDFEDFQNPKEFWNPLEDHPGPLFCQSVEPFLISM